MKPFHHADTIASLWTFKIKKLSQSNPTMHQANTCAALHLQNLMLSMRHPPDLHYASTWVAQIQLRTEYVFPTEDVTDWKW